MGRALFEAARIAFATEAAAQAPAQMASSAEGCAADEPAVAIAMLADAAGSAVTLDQVDLAVRYAERAMELAAGQPGFVGDLARTTIHAVQPLVTDEIGDTENHDHAVSVMNTERLFAGSPQLAYVLGNSLVQSGPPALVGRWFSWMGTSAEVDSSGALAAVLDLVRCKERLIAGAVTEAMTAAEAAVGQFEVLGNRPLLARALGWCAWARASAGEVAGVFESAAQFFAHESSTTHSARLQVLAALAHGELQKGHAERAIAWLRSLESDAATLDGFRGSTDWPLLPFFLQLCLMAGHDPKRTRESLDAGTAASSGRWNRHVSGWSEALREPNAHAALRLLDEMFVAGPTRMPLMGAQIKFTSGLLLRELGSIDAARFNVNQANTEFQHCGALGWATLTTLQLEDPLSNSQPANRTQPTLPGIERESGHVGTMAAGFGDSPLATESDRRPAYEVRILGQFSVWRDGVAVTIPPGRAAQAIKVVALFRRISVDELAELLWPDAEPGVGTRRLRNILWRVKASSGDLLRRQDNFIGLEDNVTIDAARFEEMAGRAFREDLDLDEAHAIARQAISLYGGEVLPTDRYADWTTGPREALTQMRLQLLDLMLAHASDSGNRQEAFALLEDLIDADPYEERYYVQLATLHKEAGNLSRMRSSISRGERMLADLGVEPSRHFVEAADKLQADA